MNLQELIQFILGTVITVALPVVVKYVLDSLKEVSVAYSDKVTSDVIKDRLKNISDTIYQVTICTTQTYVDALKAQGSFDKEAQDKAFELTKSTVKVLLNKEAEQLIQDIYGDLDTWLDTKIEQTVKETKVFSK